MVQTIEIDCPPGYPRPGDLIEAVIKDTGLPARNDVSRLFGCWTWDYNDILEADWLKAKPILKDRLTKLYDNGVVRYCSW